MGRGRVSIETIHPALNQSTSSPRRHPSLSVLVPLDTQPRPQVIVERSVCCQALQQRPFSLLPALPRPPHRAHGVELFDILAGRVRDVGEVELRALLDFAREQVELCLLYTSDAADE